MKGLAQTEKMFATHVSNNRLLFRIHNEIWQLNKQRNQQRKQPILKTEKY